MLDYTCQYPAVTMGISKTYRGGTHATRRDSDDFRRTAVGNTYARDLSAMN